MINAGDKPTGVKTVYGSVQELADELGLGISKTYEGLRAGQIPAIRIGRRFIVPRAAIAEWLRNGGKAA